MLEKIINKNTEYSRTATRTDGTPTMYWIPKEDIEKYKWKENIYFLSWGILSEKKEQYHRFKDNEIHTKNYFAIDIDLRNQCTEKLSNLDIVKEWLALVPLLAENHKLLWQWSYVVFSWNWLHVYYVWKEQAFNAKQFKLWVKYIFNMWDELFGIPEYKSDHACCNLARILRLPGSINQKNWAKAQILAEQDSHSELFDNIKLYALIQWGSDMMESIRSQKEIAGKNYNTDGDDDYQKINSIPAHVIAEIVVPWFTFSKNGKNFNNKKKWFTWYYYVKATNSICNGWSRYFNYWNENSCFANFQIIQKEYNFSNRETFEWFRKNFTI